MDGFSGRESLRIKTYPALQTMPVPNIPERFNLAAYMVDRHLLEGSASKTAIVADGQQLTYAQLAERMNRVGNALRRLGVQEEQRVLLLLPDSPEFAAAFLGAIKIGAVPVPSNTSLRPPDYSYFLDETRARVLFVHSSLLPQVQPVLSSRPHLRHTVVVGDRCEGYSSWEHLLSDSSPVLDAAPTGKNDVAFWLWTSGSTGPPKGAVHLQHDWIYCCEYYGCGILGICDSDVTFSTSKLYHAYGLGNSMMFPFYVGATTVLDSAAHGKTQAGVLLGKISRARPTLFFSVPTLYASMLADTDRGNPYDPDQHSSGRVRSRAIARGTIPQVAGPLWIRNSRRDRIDGSAAHLYFRPCRRCKARQQRAARAGVQSAGCRRERHGRPLRGEAGRADGSRRKQCAVLLGSPQIEFRANARRVVCDGRQILYRPGRLFLVHGPFR